MSRSASLTLNLLLSTMDVNGIPVGDAVTPHMRIIDLAQVGLTKCWERLR
jgi:hypothetical protein